MTKTCQLPPEKNLLEHIAAEAFTLEVKAKSREIGQKRDRRSKSSSEVAIYVKLYIIEINGWASLELAIYHGF